ncbi:polygalacturonase-like [Ipomoea triloba]|uniref:polygalacturonase-like n=1 Tax=Ipomoea triloba TaxID=35885 RepID=UPI00125E0438|nr:polygalacturonase-like [Ipomoea triloba]
MGRRVSYFFPLALTLVFLAAAATVANAMYNVESYGAKADGRTDSSAAFLKAWDAVCALNRPATILVPRGEFLLRNVLFHGEKCGNRNGITFQISGTLLAPSDYNVIGHSDAWIKFNRVTALSIIGGTLDAQGSSLWKCKNGKGGCPEGSTTLAIYDSDNVAIMGLTSQNSQKFHILIKGTRNAKLQGVKISAPEDSPNTDGIHVQSSSGVTITNSNIGTGDDCISIGPGTTNLLVQSIACGPGHGISIGSLGWSANEAGVENVKVRNVQFTGTENGVRIKTWARPSNGYVRNVLFQRATMVDVHNPIIIDQNYCPHNENCPHQSSGIKISGITFEDIHGTSATEVGVELQCSKSRPCSGITVDDVKLTYNGRPAQASCTNAACPRIFSRY